MAKKIYVGNLAYKTAQSTLEELFSEYGTVESVSIISDRDTGRSKGFAFVEMGEEAEAEAAISALNGKEVDGRQIVASEAREKQERREGGGGRFNREKSFSGGRNRRY